MPPANPLDRVVPMQSGIFRRPGVLPRPGTIRAKTARIGDRVRLPRGEMMVVKNVVGADTLVLRPTFGTWLRWKLQETAWRVRGWLARRLGR